MAKKTSTLDAAILKRIKKLGINNSNEEDIRKKLLALLEKQGIEGMEEEDTETLLEMAESFVEEDNDNEVDEELDDEDDSQETDDEEDDSDDAEDEEEDDDNSDDEEEDDEPTDEDLDELAEEVENEEPAPAPKKAKKEAPAKKKEAPAKKKEAPAKKKEAPAKKEKKETKKVNKRGTKLTPKENEDDRKHFNVFKDLFPEDTCQYDWVQTGVTIKNKGINSKRAMVLIENCSLKDDGTIRCNLYLLTMTKKKEVLDEKGIDYKTCWSGQPFCSGVTFDEAIAIITELKDEITGFVTKVDKKLGENRKKMEDNLKSAAKKKATAASSKKATKKAAKPEVEDDEVDDEVDE